MKDKASLFKPAVFVMLFATVTVTGLTFFYDLELFYIAAAVCGTALIFLLFTIWRAEREIDRFVGQLGAAIGAMQDQTLRDFPLPVVVASRPSDEIVWYNGQFERHVLGKEKLYGEPVRKLIKSFEPGGEGCVHSFSFGNREYTAYSVKSQRDGADITAFYLIDDTDLKRDAREYLLSRPAVMVIMIDSYDDLLQNAKENERSQLLSQIEYCIENFIGAGNGVVVKTDRDKFVAILEERYMKEIIEKRFEVLDHVRGLTGPDKLPVTLSIGVARNIPSFAEGDQWARQALDMSLGRGGDQAAVKTEGGYDFYGGVSKGVEKRTKVKTRIVATALKELIETSSNVIIMGHKFADLDSLGSAVGLLGAVRTMGKSAFVAIDRKRNLVVPLIERLEQNGYEGSFLDPDEAIERVTAQTLLIITDTHIEHVVESSELYRACKTVVVIDHHRRMVGYIDNAVIFYHEPYASSASEMVTELVQYFGDRTRISRLEAEALLAGIMLDTKNFVIKTGVRTFEAAAYLRRQGADTVEVRKLFASSMESYQQRSRVVSSAEIYRRCAISTSNAPSEDIKLVAPQAADELLTINDVDASFVLYDYDGGVSISARSMGKINVQVIMEKLKGGGHQTMAATQLSNVTLEDARQMLLLAIDEYYENNIDKKPKPAQ